MTALALAALLGIAAPALAAPMGPIMRASFKGWLGNSGLHVQTTPQSVLITHVAKGSASAAAGIAGISPKQVLRILQINGRPVSELSTAQLREAFRAPRVALIVGRRGPTDLEEIREGPLVVALGSSATARAYDLAGQGQWQRALEAAKADPGLRSAIVSRMLFEAQRLAIQGDPASAVRLLALVPRDEQGHQRALELSRQYERVSQEARRTR